MEGQREDATTGTAGCPGDAAPRHPPGDGMRADRGRSAEPRKLPRAARAVPRRHGAAARGLLVGDCESGRESRAAISPLSQQRAALVPHYDGGGLDLGIWLNANRRRCYGVNPTLYGRWRGAGQADVARGKDVRYTPHSQQTRSG